MGVDPSIDAVFNTKPKLARYEAVEKEVMKVFEDAAKGCSKDEQKALEDLAPVVRDAISAAIRAYNPRPD